MHEPITAILHEWHDFYVTVGTAAGALIGAMFVVMSVGAGVIKPEHLPHTRTYFTATLVHLAGVLLACAVATVPSLDLYALAGLLVAGGLVGLGFAAAQVPRVWRSDLGLEDLLWYALLPVTAYLLVLT